MTSPPNSLYFQIMMKSVNLTAPQILCPSAVYHPQAMNPNSLDLGFPHQIIELLCRISLNFQLIVYSTTQETQYSVS